MSTNFKTLIVLIIALALQTVAPLFASVPISQYTCQRSEGPVKIDGLLDEPAWEKAKPVELRNWNARGKPKYKTEAKMLWDDQYLYVGFWCQDQEIWTPFSKRDDPLYNAEVVEIFIDPTGKSQTYYELEVSPLNVIWDGYITKLKPPKWIKAAVDWTCEGLKTAVHIQGTLNNRKDKDEYWSVEIAIPFEALAEAPNIPPKEGDKWRINLYRIERLHFKTEFYAWSPTLTPYPDFHVPTRFGQIAFSH